MGLLITEFSSGIFLPSQLRVYKLTAQVYETGCPDLGDVPCMTCFVRVCALFNIPIHQHSASFGKIPFSKISNTIPGNDTLPGRLLLFIADEGAAASMSGCPDAGSFDPLGILC